MHQVDCHVISVCMFMMRIPSICLSTSTICCFEALPLCKNRVCSCVFVFFFHLPDFKRAYDLMTKILSWRFFVLASLPFSFYHAFTSAASIWGRFQISWICSVHSAPTMASSRMQQSEICMHFQWILIHSCSRFLSLIFHVIFSVEVFLFQCCN